MLEKSKNRARRRAGAAGVASSALLAAAVVTAGAASTAQATTKTWDLDSAGHNNGVINNGGGTWSNKTADSNWTTNGGTTNTSFANSGDDAVFGGNPGIGAAGTVTLSGDQTVNSITFNAAASGGFTIAGTNQIVFSIPATSITQNSSAATMISAPIEGIDTTLTLGGTGTSAVTLGGPLTELSSSHPLALIKTGIAPYILTNASNSYSGVTNINGGTLTVNGTLGGTGALNVNSTGKLAGTGTVSKTVTLNSGATISPADDGANTNVGTLTTGAQNWEGGSTYVWEIKNASTGAGTNYDTLSVGGKLQLDATSGNKMTIKVVSHGPVANWNRNAVWNWDVATYTSFGGSFSASNFLLDVSDFIDDNSADAGSFTVTQSGSSIRVSYVPEPAAALLGGIGLAGAAMRRRRRRGL